MEAFIKMMTANIRPYNTHKGIGLNELKRLSRIKREQSIKPGQQPPIAHMAGSFGFK